MAPRNRECEPSPFSSIASMVHSDKTWNPSADRTHRIGLPQHNSSSIGFGFGVSHEIQAQPWCPLGCRHRRIVNFLRISFQFTVRTETTFKAPVVSSFQETFVQCAARREMPVLRGPDASNAILLFLCHHPWAVEVRPIRQTATSLDEKLPYRVADTYEWNLPLQLAGWTEALVSSTACCDSRLAPSCS
jgi:hypothetical protein